MPMLDKIMPVLDLPLLSNLSPNIAMTRPTMLTGKPKSGIKDANKPIIPRIIPDVALPLLFFLFNTAYSTVFTRFDLYKFIYNIHGFTPTYISITSSSIFEGSITSLTVTL